LPILAAALVAGLASVGHAQAARQTPDFSADQAKRGAESYEANCALCHGPRLDDGEFAPALKGPAHAAYWRGKTAEDMLNYMNTAMPPSEPGGLGAQAYADVMAFMLQAAGAIPGDKPLPTDPAALRGAAPTR
jgi:mono/diheme cytochrome c family protein